MDNKKLGQLGEDIAVDYLLDKEYKILDRNYTKTWSSRFKGEIDIVAKKDKIISFIEVKTSQGFCPKRNEGFYPEERVNFKKQSKLVRLAQAWLEENNMSTECLWQIDVVSVVVTEGIKEVKISHFKNAVCES